MEDHVTVFEFHSTAKGELLMNVSRINMITYSIA